MGPSFERAAVHPEEDDSIDRDGARRHDGTAPSRRHHGDAPGAYRPIRRGRWSLAEDAIVRDGYADGKTRATISRSLPGRSPASVAARARLLGLCD
jgi:hypothetical protein